MLAGVWSFLESNKALAQPDWSPKVSQQVLHTKMLRVVSPVAVNHSLSHSPHWPSSGIK